MENRDVNLRMARKDVKAANLDESIISEFNSCWIYAIRILLKLVGKMQASVGTSRLATKLQWFAMFREPIFPTLIQ